MTYNKPRRPTPKQKHDTIIEWMSASAKLDYIFRVITEAAIQKYGKQDTSEKWMVIGSEDRRKPDKNLNELRNEIDKLTNKG